MLLRLKGRDLYYGWVVVGAAFLILYGAYGVQYSFGVFLPEIEGALAPGKRAVISLGFSIYASLYCILASLSGRLTDLWGPRPVLIAGGILLGLGILLVGRATSLWQYFLAYGLLASLGMSTTYVPTTSTIVKWFVARRGLMVGMAMAGSGIGQLTLPLLTALLIGGWGWRTTYLAYGLALATLLPLLGLLLERDPEARGLRPYGAPAALSGSEDVKAEDRSLRPSEALRTLPFWLYTGALFLFWSVVFVPVVHLPAFARGPLGSSSGLAALTITAIAVGSTLGRVLGGAVSDLLGRRRTFVLVILGQTLSFFGLLLASLIGSLGLTYGSAVLFGMGYGSTGAIYPAFTADLFGRRYASSVAGLIFGFAAGATGIGIYLAGFLYQATGSYTVAFASSGALTLAALPLILAVKRPLRPSAAVEETSPILHDAKA